MKKNILIGSWIFMSFLLIIIIAAQNIQGDKYEHLSYVSIIWCLISILPISYLFYYFYDADFSKKRIDVLIFLYGLTCISILFLQRGIYNMLEIPAAHTLLYSLGFLIPFQIFIYFFLSIESDIISKKRRVISEQVKEELKQYIFENNIPKTISKLDEILIEVEDRDQLIHLSQRLKEIEDDLQSQRIVRQEYQVMKANFTRSIISFINDI